VDDDDSMRRAIARLLGAAGFLPRSYPSAEALLADEAREGAACIVCDMRLPAMSGLDLLSELRSRGGWPPLILITAHDAPGVREDAERLGAAAYLPKPFLGTALLEKIRAVVNPARSR